MLETNKMVQDGRVKNIRRAMIPPKGKRKGGIWGTKSFSTMCQPIQNIPCDFNEPFSFS